MSIFKRDPAAKEAHDKLDAAVVARHHAQIARKAGDLDKARELLDQAEALADEAQLRLMEP